MTTQAQDLGKTLGASMIAAADKHGTAIVAASIHIHTGLSQIAEALGYRNPAGRRQDAPGTPRMPGARETPTEPLRDAQDATQPVREQRPDWADALVVQDGDGNPPHPQACAERVAELQEQLHAVARERDEALSSNEPEWLDADELEDCPAGTLALPSGALGCWPRRKGHDGLWRANWNGDNVGLVSAEIAPARVLWTPETDR